MLLNTITLICYDYRQRLWPDEEYKVNDLSLKLDYVFAGVFLLEFVLQVVAMGFVVGKFTYLRDPWNIIDFLVTMDGYHFVLM